MNDDSEYREIFFFAFFDGQLQEHSEIRFRNGFCCWSTAVRGQLVPVLAADPLSRVISNQFRKIITDYLGA